MENYPSNSHKSKEKRKDEPKRIQKVISGSAKVQKKSALRKFIDIFIPDDVNSIKDDIIIPAGKKLLFDIFEAVLYPNGGGKRSSSSSKIAYGSFYNDRNNDRRESRHTGLKNGYLTKDVIVESRGEAEMVLDILDEQIGRYNLVSVADLYDAVGIDDTNNYMNDKYGWTDIRNARVVPVRDGYLIKMPRAVPLD